MFKTEHVEQLIALANSMVSDLEGQFSKIPVYVSYLIKHIEKSIRKEMIKKNADKKEFEKLKITLFRLFFKNIISKLLKTLGKDNSDYLSKLLGYSNENRKRVE